MKIILMLLLLPTVLTGQETRDTIIIKRGFLSEGFFYQERSVGIRDLYWITKNYPEAHAEMLKAEKKWNLGRALTSPLLGLLLWANNDETPDDTRVALGVAMLGIIAVTIPISFSGGTNFRKSIRSFNEGR